MGVGEWKSRAHPFPLITGFCICHFIDINENEKDKRVREDMLKRAERYSRKHIASCENWQEGLPVKCWKGEFGAMWIEWY